MPDADLPLTRFEANGVAFSAFEVGSGPLALCLHGFPDTPHTWRHLIRPLSHAGYRVVAPFARGYAPTSIPADARFTLAALAADANAIHDTLHADETSVLIGSDWGAETAYVAAAAEPKRWRRLVTIGVPPAALDDVLVADADQLDRFNYVTRIRQLLSNGVTLGPAEVDDLVSSLWLAWSPDFHSRDEIAHLLVSLSNADALKAALTYYVDNLLDGSGAFVAPPQPTLYLHGRDDGCIRADLVTDALNHLAPGSRLEIVPGGHFLQVEHPSIVNDLILDWLA